MGGVGKKFVFNYLTGVGQTLLLGFFFPPFYFFFPKRGEKELGKGSWPAVGGRGSSWESGTAPMKLALGGPLEKCLGGPPPAPPPARMLEFQ